MLKLNFNGSATLFVSCNNRSSISFDGDIKELKRAKNTEGKTNN